MNIEKWKGLLYGTTYGLVSRSIFALEDFRGNALFPTYGLMTMSFMFIVPFVIGLITAYHNDKITSSRKIVFITMPFFAILGLISISVLSGKEGIICALMALPVFLFMALLGGFIGVRIFKRNKPNNKLYVSFFILLPFLFAPIENLIGLTDKIFTEHTTVEINASDKTVWDNITRVKEISEFENNNTLFQFMGFPRPIEAQLDTIAIGGVRKAIFDRGLFFTETITQMQINRILAFNIIADPESIPPKALDEHVLVGGKYFDVLEGKYVIEKINEKKVVLHLTSQFRLSTSFNFYSGFWSKLIMKDIQENILAIIKRRSEENDHSNSI
ncbi:MAG: hypothetical protein DWP98_03490 [Bacteroidetes bacterium]|nr:MAG: hypothetical protein DWP98_03490 [Bacteroidota bacterium]MBL1144124.1 hypothetical protein [Bacteroidota bacterium]MCB0803499.1 hypothetical protein [Flavobacteriales bacterium]NOG56919.1 hypothetical protein [Bacteroidota bacterium]